MTPEGAHYAVPVPTTVETGRSKNKNTPFVKIDFRIVDGEARGDIIPWTGWLTDKTRINTEKSFKKAGWNGDWKEIAVNPTPVEIVVEHETYNNRIYPKVRWINDLPANVAIEFMKFGLPEEQELDDLPF